jgi:quercetin dioxygenase-like cupin family protein
MNQVELSPYVSDFANLPRMTQLLREGGIRAFLLHLHALEEMPDHKVKGAITVQCLHGSVLFSTEQDSVELITGSIISLPGGVLHKLVARRGSLMLVTVSEQ